MFYGYLERYSAHMASLHSDISKKKVNYNSLEWLDEDVDFLSQEEIPDGFAALFKAQEESQSVIKEGQVVKGRVIEIKDDSQFKRIKYELPQYKSTPLEVALTKLKKEKLELQYGNKTKYKVRDCSEQKEDKSNNVKETQILEMNYINKSITELHRGFTEFREVFYKSLFCLT